MSLYLKVVLFVAIALLMGAEPLINSSVVIGG